MDFANLKNYRENNRLEAKSALGGLPRSLWETYSAFSNTSGGIILLGVLEHKDKTLHAENLPDPDKLINEFWTVIHNKNKVSVNILSDRHISKMRLDGNTIIAITVPKAERFDRPVYIGANPFDGTYRRNGEGDYKCSKEEVQAMLRDAAVKTQDMLVLKEMRLNVLDYDSLHRYRNRMKNYRPGHVWEELDDDEFLYRLGAAARSEDGAIHPTAAGLLMFGYEYEIVKEYPNYFLDYQERMDDSTRWTDRIVSSSGDWSGNIYDFYFRVYNKLTQDVKVPFKLEGGDRIDDTPVHKALREALANCLINADYYGRQGVVVIKDKKGVSFSNPGNFRIDIEVAKSGGVSDPRNSALIKIFNLIDIGERAGSGIPSILSAWEREGWGTPVIEESFDPDRIKVTLDFKKGSDNPKKVAIKGGDNPKKVAIKSSDKIGVMQRKAVLKYLEDNEFITTEKAAELLDVKTARARRILSSLVEEGGLIAEGANRNRVYKLKSD